MDRRGFIEGLTGAAAGLWLDKRLGATDRRGSARRRIFFYEDSTQMLMSGDGRMKRDQVERWVQTLAGTQVDVISWVAALPDVCFFDTRIGDRFGRGGSVYESWEWEIVKNLESLISAGDDPLKVVCETAHRAGIQVMAAVRMNDEHQGGSLQGGFFGSHPEWRIAKSVALDYSFAEVRDHRFAVIQEVVERFDVDGLELDWMRWMKIFPPGEGMKRAPILTDYVRSIRKMLDEEGKRKGRRLELGARVAPKLQRTREMGIDLGTWIAERLIDYVQPSEFIYNNFNLPVEEYRELTQGTQCGLYPTLHPYYDFWPKGEDEGRQLTIENYRALAHSYYAQGADGVSTYNFFPQELAFSPAYSESELLERYLREQAKALKEIGDPQAVASGKRVYAFYGPLALKVGDRLAMPVRVPEKGTVLLRFKATNMTWADRLQVDINGTEVPEASGKRTHYTRRVYGWEPSLPMYYLHEVPVQIHAAEAGKAEIGFRLIKKDDSVREQVIIREVEIETT
jgi:hypothetical protein